MSEENDPRRSLLSKRNLTTVDVNNVLDLLDDGDSSLLTDQLDDEDKVGVSYVNITVVPPTEEAGVATDEDSDGSDDEADGNFIHLPRKILSAGAQLTVGKKQISVLGEKCDIVEEVQTWQTRKCPWCLFVFPTSLIKYHMVVKSKDGWGGNCSKKPKDSDMETETETEDTGGESTDGGETTDADESLVDVDIVLSESEGISPSSRDQSKNGELEISLENKEELESTTVGRGTRSSTPNHQLTKKTATPWKPSVRPTPNCHCNSTWHRCAVCKKPVCTFCSDGGELEDMRHSDLAKCNPVQGPSTSKSTPVAGSTPAKPSTLRERLSKGGRPEAVKPPRGKTPNSRARGGRRGTIDHAGDKTPNTPEMSSRGGQRGGSRGSRGRVRGNKTVIGEKRKKYKETTTPKPKRRTQQDKHNESDSEDEDEAEETIVQEVTEPDWSQTDVGNVGSKVPKNDMFDTQNDQTYAEILENCKTPYDFFRLMFTDDLMRTIIEQSKLYGVQMNLENEVQFMTEDNLLTFVGILILSGYAPLPRRSMYWRREPDTHNKLVADSMRRDTFDHIMRILHFADNQLLDPDDKFYKIRPLFDAMNDAFKIIKPSQKISIDERMSKYYGPHSSKQAILNKPIRMGFKVWTAADALDIAGFVLHGEPYCGASTRLAKTGLGVGADVVLGLATKCNLPPGGEIFMDNYFTGMSLLDQLSASGWGGTGTCRQDRTRKAPLPSKKEMSKRDRGAMETVYAGDKVLTMWNDNNAVIVASNVHNVGPTVPTNRWNRVEKKKKEVDMPQMISQYNKHMRAVDLFDSALNLYRPRIRSKKWWWSLWVWSLMAMVNNAWRLYQRVIPNSKKYPQLDFTRELVKQMLKLHGTFPIRPGPNLPLIGRNVVDEIRFDTTVTHLVKVGVSKDRKCKQCKKKTTFLCQRCDAPLHPKCFINYHTRGGQGEEVDGGEDVEGEN